MPAFRFSVPPHHPVLQHLHPLPSRVSPVRSLRWSDPVRAALQPPSDEACPRNCARYQGRLDLFRSYRCSDPLVGNPRLVRAASRPSHAVLRPRALGGSAAEANWWQEPLVTDSVSRRNFMDGDLRDAKRPLKDVPSMKGLEGIGEVLACARATKQVTDRQKRPECARARPIIGPAQMARISAPARKAIPQAQMLWWAFCGLCPFAVCRS